MNQEKFNNTVLYLLNRAPGRPGRMHLLKMLFFADYEHYRRYLSPVTGADYVALPDGPVVNDYKQVFGDLVSQGVLEVREVPIAGLQNKKIEYRPLRQAELSVFSQSELAILDAVVREHGSSTGVALSEKTHRDGPWQLAFDKLNQGNRIPYMLFRWIDNYPEEQDIELARQAMLDRGLDQRVAQLNAQGAA